MQRVLETVTSSVVFWSDIGTGAAIRSLNRTTCTQCSVKDLLRCFQRNSDLIVDRREHYSLYEKKLKFAINHDNVKLLQYMVELRFHLVSWEEHFEVDRETVHEGDITVHRGM